MTTSDGRDGLEALADVPSPRRNDAAFARAVKDGVARRHARTFFAFPALAAAAAAFAFLVMRPDDGHPDVVAHAVDERPLMIADPFDDEDALFALPSLDGSSDQELADLDRVLDRRIAASRRSP